MMSPGSEDLICKTAFQHCEKGILVILDESLGLCAAASHPLTLEKQCEGTD